MFDWLYYFLGVVSIVTKIRILKQITTYSQTSIFVFKLYL